APTPVAPPPPLSPPADSPVRREVETLLVNWPPNSNTILFTNFSVLYESTDRPNQVCKVPKPLPEFERAHEVERRIYRRLGEHPNLVKVIEMDQHGIWLERALHGCLRQFNMEGGEATLLERLQWCEDVARVLDFVHGKNVRHADLSGRNLLVDAEKRILLCDFSGSSIDDEAATIMAENGYRHPDEIHTLGSTLYEIITGEEPHNGIEKEAIGKLLEQGKYADVADVPLGEIIRRCWDGGFNSALEVAEEIARYRKMNGQIESCPPGL
ncbi:Tyrosine-protein kinase transforming protein erbB, partial [Tolypocladium ophioglossoides CBS 100239]